MNRLLLQLLFGVLLAFFVINVFFSGNKKFDELALGTETFTYMARDGGGKNIHISNINSLEESDFIQSYDEQPQKDVILFLGNSQTHSINQMKNGEVNFIRMLHDSFQNKNAYLFCHSIPNAGLQEFYVSFMYWEEKLKIKSLVIPLFFDDLREDGIRDVFFTNLISNHFQVNDTLSKIGKKVNANLRSYWSQATISKDTIIIANKDNDALKETVQENIENSLNLILEKHLESWNNRVNVRGDFFVWLYQLRNTVLGIKASTIRKMIPQRYEDNMAALQLILEECKKNNINVLLYIPPIRSDIPLPYQSDLYNSFKSSVKEICMKEKGLFYFADFDTIIPGNLWGYKEATNLTEKREADYMHFQFKGHQILADSLYNHLKLLNN
jgi:hypothetical protein